MLRFAGGAQQPLLGVLEGVVARTMKKPGPFPVTLPQGFEPMPATPRGELDRVVAALDARKQAWGDTPARERAQLLRRCLDATLRVYEEGAEASTKAKGSYGDAMGEELITWLPVVTILRELIDALEADGRPRPQGIRKTPAGQSVVDVFPLGMESLLFGGFKGEVWIEPGKEPTQGKLYREMEEGRSTPSLALVLGAGNQLPVVTGDILHQLVCENAVVVCKMNPVNEYMGPFVRRSLQPLVDAGFVEIVYGGGDVGKYLCNHPSVAAVHLTGSAATYDAIVWQGKKKVGKPPFTKPVYAELGSVTPYIVVPGVWSQADLEYQAESVAAGLTHNAGHNCLAAEVVVTDANWPQREAFLEALRRSLAAAPCRVAYYPGSEKKFEAFKKRFPDSEAIEGAANQSTGDDTGAPRSGGGGGAAVKPSPWLLKTGLAPDQASLQEENWCGVLQEVALPCGNDPAVFLAAATQFANERCWGTLSCALFIHPATQRQFKQQFEAAIEELRFGGIAVNGPTVLVFALTKMGWGAFPGHTIHDIRSGNCFVHNTLMLDHPQKSVLYAPWHYHPLPFWFPSHKNMAGVARAAIAFSANPSLLNLMAAARQALLG